MIDYLQLAQDVRDTIYDLGRLPGVDVSQLETLTKAADVIETVPALQKNAELNFLMWWEAKEKLQSLGVGT